MRCELGGTDMGGARFACWEFEEVDWGFVLGRVFSADDGDIMKIGVGYRGILLHANIIFGARI